MQTNRRDFIKRSGAAAFTLGMFPILSKANDFWSYPGSNGFTRMSPESQGISSAAIRQFISAAQASGLQWHSLMLLRHGYVVAEGWWKPFDANYKHTLYSLSKSFTSTAIGLLVKDGKLSVEDSLISFFPDELPIEISDNLREMKVRNLLTMNTGHAEDTTPKMIAATVPWTKTFLSLPVEHKPGSHFLYNTGATYMLGAIVKKLTAQDLETFLTPRLFAPLEINDHDWEKSPQGLNVAGWGLRVKTEDIAKLGQLYLQNGKWNGKEILTEAWVKDAGSYQTTSNTGDSDWNQGYGYQFWRCKPGFFRGDGAFGQYCVVMPQHDAVLVVTSESWDMQKQMTIMWENLLPAMQPSPLPKNETEHHRLKSDLANLSLPVNKGSVSSAVFKKYNLSKWKFDANEYTITAMQFQFSEKGCTVQLDSQSGKRTIQSGWENWTTNNESLVYPFFPAKVNLPPSKIASTATWMSDNTLQLNLKLVEAIHGDKITCVFEGDKISISFLNSVAENSKDRPDGRPKLEGTPG